MKISSGLYSAIRRSMISRYMVYAVNLLSMMSLARIFTPESFGTVAAITVFFVFFQLMTEAGLGPAIINLSKLSTDDRDGLFGLTFLIGLSMALLFATMAPVFQTFYRLPRVDEVVPFVAVSILFCAAGVVPTALLLREQAFFKIAIAGLVAEMLSTAATIVLTLLIDSLHALAAKSAFSAATLFFVTWYFSAHSQFGRPKLGRKLSAVKPLMVFSGYQFGFNFINYFARNLDNILLAKYMGATALGSYDKAYQLMRYPLMLLTFAMTPAVQPVIRQHSGEPRVVEKIHRDFTFKLSLVGVAVGMAMYALSEWVILIALGNQWVDVAPIIRILAIAIPVQVILSTSGSFFQAMNRADLLFICGVFGAVVMVTAIILGIVFRDIEILCWGIVVALHINFVQVYYVMYKKVFYTPLHIYLLRMLPGASVVVFMIVYSLI